MHLRRSKRNFREHYKFKLPQVRSVFEHLLSLPHALIEDRPSLETALASCQLGLNFADAYHHASYSCNRKVLRYFKNLSAVLSATS
jgi:hypothetical protein